MNGGADRRFWLRPTAFVDNPFAWPARRLAGGLQYFSAVELIALEGGALTTEPLGVEAFEERLGALGPAVSLAWERIVTPRPPLKLGPRAVPLDQPRAVAILNVTPDSFSDGGRHFDPAEAIAAGQRMSGEGAAIVDVGGESTRPGAAPVWEDDEAGRILPVVQSLAASGTAVSVDTRKASVMEQALGAGAAMINDVSALTFDPLAAETIARAGCPIVLMHHLGPPETMQDDPQYARPVILEVYDWLEARIVAAEASGIERTKIIVDPGFGFGKTVAHNLALMNGLAMLHGLGCPIMIGASRKRTIGALDNEAPVASRLAGSLAFALKAAEQGAQLIRVHDVAETLQALRVWRGLRDLALSAPA